MVSVRLVKTGSAFGSLIVDGVRVAADVALGNRPKDSLNLFTQAIVDGVIGFLAGATFGRFTKDGRNLSDALTQYAQSISRARALRFHPNDLGPDVAATFRQRVQAQLKSNVAIKEVNELYGELAKELGLFFSFDSAAGSLLQTAGEWVWDSGRRR